MKTLYGTGISFGVAVAPIYKKYDHKTHIVHSTISHHQVEQECKRFVEGVESAKKEYTELLQEKSVQTKDSNSTLSTDIIAVHLMLLEDPEFHKGVHAVITQSLSNAEWAVKQVIQEYSNKLPEFERRIYSRSYA